MTSLTDTQTDTQTEVPCRKHSILYTNRIICGRSPFRIPVGTSTFVTDIFRGVFFFGSAGKYRKGTSYWCATIFFHNFSELSYPSVTSLSTEELNPPLCRIDRTRGLQEVEAVRIVTQSAHASGKLSPNVLSSREYKAVKLMTFILVLTFRISTETPYTHTGFS
jgi:hypothetical protein